MANKQGPRAAVGACAVLSAVALTALFLPIVSALPARSASAVPPSPARASEVPALQSTPDLRLEEILARAAEYCRRLESSAFDFVCREEIRETIDPSLEAGLKDSNPGVFLDLPDSSKFLGPTVSLRSVRKIKRTYVYDYQCVRAGRVIREVRTQLQENGKKKVVPNAELKTSIVVFNNVLLGPAGLFAERFRGGYDFTIAGEAKIGKTRVLVIDARPRPGAPPTRNLYGKAWVEPATGDILRIEWSENRVGHFGIFEERGKKLRRTPRLVLRSDFSAEKNGIRFPSSLTVEEAYLKGSGKAFVRSRTEVVYKDFKFFSVEYDVRD